jgi:hypothetical protein
LAEAVMNSARSMARSPATGATRGSHAAFVGARSRFANQRGREPVRANQRGGAEGSGICRRPAVQPRRNRRRGCFEGADRHGRWRRGRGTFGTSCAGDHPRVMEAVNSHEAQIITMVTWREVTVGLFVPISVLQSGRPMRAARVGGAEVPATRRHSTT